MKSRNLLLVALLLLVGVGVVYLLGGPDVLFGAKGGGGGSAAQGGPDAAGAPEEASAHAGAGEAEGAAGKPKRARLFGSPRSERKGVGSLSARVVRFSDQKPVAEATLLLTGTSNADAAVSLRAATDANGAASFREVPAGDDYDLRVEPRSDPPAHIPAVAVAPGAAKDLGTIYVGQLSALAGRVTD